MEKQSGLGRGLSSLIPDKKNSFSAAPKVAKYPADFQSDENSGVSDSEANKLFQSEEIAELPVEKISPSPHQARQDFSWESLSELAGSIKQHGIVQPLVVCPKDGGWELIAGERRLRAAKIVGLKKVPAIIRDWDEQKKMEVSLVENLQRQDLNPLERAAGYRKLIDQFNLTHNQLAARLGRSREGVTNILRLLEAPEDVKEAIRKKEITEGHARPLLGLPEAARSQVISAIKNKKFNVRQAEQLGRELAVKKKLRSAPPTLEIKAKEEKLAEYLGTRVAVKSTGRTGKIVIKFFSLDQLDQLLKKIFGQE